MTNSKLSGVTRDGMRELVSTNFQCSLKTAQQFLQDYNRGVNAVNGIGEAQFGEIVKSTLREEDIILIDCYTDGYIGNVTFHTMAENLGGLN